MTKLDKLSIEGRAAAIHARIAKLLGEQSPPPAPKA